MFSYTSATTTTTATDARSWVVDTADRSTTGANSTGAYGDDLFGRQTTIPGIDTPNGAGAGDLTIGYYDSDAARALTQGTGTAMRSTT